MLPKQVDPKRRGNAFKNKEDAARGRREAREEEKRLKAARKENTRKRKRTI